MRMMLRDACQFYSGTGFPEIYQGIEDGQYPFFKVGDISANIADGNVYLQRCGNYITEEVAAIIHGTIIPPGAVVFAKIGEALKKNRRALTVCNCLVDNNAMGIAPRSEVLRTKYFFYYMCNLKMQEYAETTAVPSVRKSRLEQIYIDVPDLIEQEIIEKKLDAITGIIKERQRQLSILDTLIKARFVEMFGDYHTNSKGFETHKGSELFRFSSGKFLPEEKRLESGIPVYGGNGIAWYTDTPLIDYPTIIIGRVGAQCGNIHTVTMPVWITDNAIYIKEMKTEKFTLEFLSEMMRIMDFYQYADFSRQPKITQKPLETLEYLTPPKVMQEAFTEFCSRVDKSKYVDFAA